MPSIRNTNSKILAKISGGDIELMEQELKKLRKKMLSKKKPDRNQASKIKTCVTDPNGEKHTVWVYLFPTEELKRKKKIPKKVTPIKITKKKVIQLLDERIQAYLDIEHGDDPALRELAQLRYYFNYLFENEEE